MADNGPNLNGWRVRSVEVLILVAVVIGVGRIYPDDDGWHYWGTVVVLWFPIHAFLLPMIITRLHGWWIRRNRSGTGG